jgi:hypothetical protein
VAASPGITQPATSSDRAAFTVLEFCVRNNISKPTYNRLRADGRGPVEMRIGLNCVRIGADAEREWQQRMSAPQEELAARATRRAVKAGAAAARSDRHVSKKKRGRAHTAEYAK